MWTDVLLILDATLRISVPFVLAAMGGIFAERSGVIDFGLEGKMLGGAFVAATVAHWTQSPWWGLLGSVGIGIIFSMMHGYASVSKRGNQVVSCVAINIFAVGFPAMVLAGMVLFVVYLVNIGHRIEWLWLEAFSRAQTIWVVI